MYNILYDPLFQLLIYKPYSDLLISNGNKTSVKAILDTASKDQKFVEVKEEVNLTTAKFSVPVYRLIRGIEFKKIIDAWEKTASTITAEKKP